MLIKVKDISISGSNLENKISPKEMDIKDNEIVLVEDVHLKGTAHRSREDVIIRLNISTAIKETCHRCLESFDLKIGGDVELFYQSFKHGTNLTFKDINSDDLGVLYYQNNCIDLRDAIRDTIVLERPMKMLCSEDCKGLCSSCGKNHNEGTCNCKKATYNPFAELLKRNGE